MPRSEFKLCSLIDFLGGKGGGGGEGWLAFGICGACWLRDGEWEEGEGGQLGFFKFLQSFDAEWLLAIK